MDAQRRMTRRAAKDLGLTQYFTGKACPKGHVGMRYTTNGVCVECSSAQAKDWRKNNPERYQEVRKAWRENNKEYLQLVTRARTERRAEARKFKVSPVNSGD